MDNVLSASEASRIEDESLESNLHFSLFLTYCQYTIKVI